MWGLFIVSGLGAVLAGALLFGASEALSHCPARCNCIENHNMGVTINCLLIMNITVDVDHLESKVEITCGNDSTRLRFGDLQQMDLGKNFSKLVLNGCRMPPSFALAESRFGATFERLQILDAPETADISSDMVKGLKRLEGLYISSKNNKEYVPSKAFSELPLLKEFSIENGIVTLRPGDFDTATSLFSLKLGRSKIRHLPDGIFRPLERLRILSLFGNPLMALSKYQLKFKSLQILDVTHCGLRKGSLNSLIAVQHSLTVLWANLNSFEELPPLGFMRKLQWVKISGNRVPLKIAPKALASLRSLEKVDLSHSGITSLPADFLAGTSSLKTLKLQGNLLTELPDDLFKDQGLLETLDLSHNRLAHLNYQVFWPLHALNDLKLDDTEIIPKIFKIIKHHKIVQQ